MTGVSRYPHLTDDSALPDAERALLERARALIPLLAERAPAATAARQLPAETIAEYHAAGILRILQPKRFGGMQGRFSLFSRIVEELTYGCASSAWVYAVLAEHQWIIAQYPEAAQIDVWGEDPLAVAASSLAPREAARRVPGGWRLSGHYPFSSGCDCAQWAIIGAFLGTKGDPRGVAYLLVPLDRGRDRRRLAGARPPRHRQQIAGPARRVCPRAPPRDGQRPLCRHPAGCAGPSRLSGVARAARVSGVLFIAAGRDRARPPRSRHRLCVAGHPGVARGDQGGPIRGRADGDRRGRRGDRCRDLAIAHRPRLQHRGVSAPAAGSPRPRRCAPAATWSTRSTRSPGR